MADAAWDIVVGVQNRAEIEALNAAIEQGEQEILRYTAALQAQGKVVQQGDAVLRAHGQSIQAATARVKELGQAAGSGNAARGLLQLGYAADDLQYGFRGIVNNIPMLVTGLGGSAGIAGVAAIAAVAVNQLVNHWDELSARLDNTETWRTASEGVREAAKAVQDNWHWLKYLSPAAYVGTELYNMLPEDQGGGALKAGRARDAKAGEKLFEKADGEVVDKQKAADFKAAIEERGGIKAVLTDALKEAMKAPGADEAAQKGRIAKWFDEGMKGGQFNPDAFNPAFGKAYDAQENRRSLKREEAATKEAEAAAKAMDKERTKELNDQGKLLEERMWADREKEIEGMEARKKAMQDQAGEARENKSRVFGGTKAFADHSMTSSMEGLAKQKLAEAKELNKKIEALRADLKSDRRVARLG